MKPLPTNQRGLRSRFTATAIAASVASLSLLSRPRRRTPPPKGPTLVVYSAQGYDHAAVAAFIKTNPGFTVTLNDNSTGPLLQQIQAEGNNPKWGVLWVDGATAFAELDNQGKLLKNSVPKVSFNKVGLANVPKDGSYTPTGLTATGALVLRLVPDDGGASCPRRGRTCCSPSSRERSG